MADEPSVAAGEGVDRDLRLPFVLPCALVVLIFIFAHLALAPQFDFVLDDWTNYFISNSRATWSEAMGVALKTHSTRPVTMVYTYSMYRLLGDNMTAYFWLSVLANSVNIVLLMAIVRKLTDEKRTALLAGLIFTLIPTISENINWCTMIISAAACAIPLFLLSALCWINFVQKDRLAWGIWSAIFYAVGLFGYEIGALLPLAFAVLLKRHLWKKVFVVGAVFATLAALYLGWRVTGGYGLIEAKALGSQFEVSSADIKTMLYTNVMNLVHWWVGDFFFGSLLSGFEGFNSFERWPRRLIMLCNVMVALLLARILFKNFKDRAPEPKRLIANPGMWFGLLWIIGSHAPSLVSYSASRLNYLPAMGVALVLAVLVRRIDARIWIGGFFVATMALLAANQGMNKNWSDSGKLNRRIYNHLEEHKAVWHDQAVVWYDTSGLAERQATGLLAEPRHDLSTVAFNGHPEQAGLLRGFGLFGMQELLKEQRRSPQVVLDVECNPRKEGDMLIYHDPHHPDRKREQPMDKVFYVDVGSLLGQK